MRRNLSGTELPLTDSIFFDATPIVHLWVRAKDPGAPGLAELSRAARGVGLNTRQISPNTWLIEREKPEPGTHQVDSVHLTLCVLAVIENLSSEICLALIQQNRMRELLLSRVNASEVPTDVARIEDLEPIFDSGAVYISAEVSITLSQAGFWPLKDVGEPRRMTFGDLLALKEEQRAVLRGLTQSSSVA